MLDRGALRISSSAGDYDVHIGEPDALGLALKGAGVVVVDEVLADTLPPTTAPVIVLAASEANKDMAACERLVLALRNNAVRRGDHLVAIGGGVVQDIATFTASIYMRGLPWTYVPTTLMAMADSCVGGKSSINAGGVKNLVGNIYPPTAVIVDPRFLPSLPAGAVPAGLAEAVKICFCRSNEAFEAYLDLYTRFDEHPADVIEHTLRAKQWFIEIDEFDQRERRLLNFGHTFGHALEVAVGHSISHGAGVAVGVLCATTHPLAATTPASARLAEHCHALLGSVPGLADALGSFDVPEFERAFRSDKKHSATSFTLILPAPDGGVREVAMPNDANSFAAVATAVRDTLGGLGA